ncbi:hypothetical protein BKA70DRAFT_1374617 [Coprinopsis sp. MPI-PUGE-AT-0042]|nr:hypothetical protein BKA70DRAFT_1374617 [Coprinopsis sp. MPI-PUGE-AT-0042]
MSFGNRSSKQSNLSRIVRKHPSVFGVPFVLVITRYDMHDQKVKQVTKEQELGLDKNRRKVDIREEYFTKKWEPVRIARPKGTPEWGVPPPEPESPPSKK